MKGLRTIGLSLLLAVVPLGGQFQAAEKVRFASHVAANPDAHMPVVAALDRGFFKEQGLEVEWVVFQATSPMQQAVAARQIEMGTSGMIGLVRGAAAGVPQLLVAEYRSSYFFFYILKDSPLKAPKDVKGTRISITRFGGDLQAYVEAVIKALGLEGQAKIMAAGGVPHRIAALKTGTAEITIGSPISMLPLIVKGEVRALLKVDDYLPEGLARNVIYARTDFLEKNSEAVKKTLAGFFRGAQFVMTNQAWTISNLKTRFRYSEEMARAALPELVYETEPKVDVTRIRNTIRFLLEYGLLAKDKVPPLERLHTPAFSR